MAINGVIVPFIEVSLESCLIGETWMLLSLVCAEVGKWNYHVYVFLPCISVLLFVVFA